MSNSEDDSDYRTTRAVKKRRKRVQDTRRVSPGLETENHHNVSGFSLDPLCKVLEDDFEGEGDDFDEFMAPSLPELLQERFEVLQREGQIDLFGNRIRPLDDHERDRLLHDLERRTNLSTGERLLRRKLLMFKASPSPLPSPMAPYKLTLLKKAPPKKPIDPEVLKYLNNIKTTPFQTSFLARVRGSTFQPDGLIGVDWGIRTPWMNVMADIREHYRLLHDSEGIEMPEEVDAPITYTTLQPSQLSQVHDLLERCFWKGIDVSDSLDYWPERSTVVATYKKVVVGIALLSSPRQTYIMYLAVKCGWDKSQIARTMLYHLISMNPGKDITLHVSANNSAMLLYNQFGFKAEGFIAGFYRQYLDPNSKASHNALMLRLRHA